MLTIKASVEFVWTSPRRCVCSPAPLSLRWGRAQLWLWPWQQDRLVSRSRQHDWLRAADSWDMPLFRVTAPCARLPASLSCWARGLPEDESSPSWQLAQQQQKLKGPSPNSCPVPAIVYTLSESYWIRHIEWVVLNGNRAVFVEVAGTLCPPVWSLCGSVWSLWRASCSTAVCAPSEQNRLRHAESSQSFLPWLLHTATASMPGDVKLRQSRELAWAVSTGGGWWMNTWCCHVTVRRLNF